MAHASYAAAEKLHVLKGHDFSRTIKANKIKRASAPEGCFRGYSFESKPFPQPLQPAVKNSSPILQSITPLRRTMKKDRTRTTLEALKMEKTDTPPPEKTPQVRFSSHPHENKHVTSKQPVKTKDLRKMGADQFSKQRTYVRATRANILSPA